MKYSGVIKIRLSSALKFNIKTSDITFITSTLTYLLIYISLDSPVFLSSFQCCSVFLMLETFLLEYIDANCYFVLTEP